MSTVRALGLTARYLSARTRRRSELPGPDLASAVRDRYRPPTG